MFIKRTKNADVRTKKKASTIDQGTLNQVEQDLSICNLANEIFGFIRDKGATAYEARWAWRIVNNRLENLTSHSEIATLVEANKKEQSNV